MGLQPPSPLHTYVSAMSTKVILMRVLSYSVMFGSAVEKAYVYARENDSHFLEDAGRWLELRFNLHFIRYMRLTI